MEAGNEVKLFWLKQQVDIKMKATVNNRWFENEWQQWTFI